MSYSLLNIINVWYLSQCCVGVAWRGASHISVKMQPGYEMKSLAAQKAAKLKAIYQSAEETLAIFYESYSAIHQWPQSMSENGVSIMAAIIENNESAGESSLAA